MRKIRYYGWLSQNHRIGLDEVKWLVWLFLGWTFWLGSGYAPQAKPDAASPVRCTECGGSMRLVAVSYTPCRTLLEHPIAYLDSG